MQFLKRVREKLAVLHLKDELLHRAVNEGFSGGEKKRNEIFQMALLEPKLAILDETDSGLDIDAMKMVADGVNAMRAPERAFVVITHYQRLLDYIVPDFVHVLADGRIVESGDRTLAHKLEEHGYAWIAERKYPIKSEPEPPDGERVARIAARSRRARGRAAMPQPAWLADARRAAADALAREGLPGARNEAWKYTSLRALEQRKPAVGDADAATRAVDARVVCAAGYRRPAARVREWRFSRGSFAYRVRSMAFAFDARVRADATASSNRGAHRSRATYRRRRRRPSRASIRRSRSMVRSCASRRRARIDAPIHLVFVGRADATRSRGMRAR